MNTRTIARSTHIALGEPRQIPAKIHIAGHRSKPTPHKTQQLMQTMATRDKAIAEIEQRESVQIASRKDLIQDRSHTLGTKAPEA